MARKLLKELGSEQRYAFVGTIERFGSKKNYFGYPEDTILIKDIYQNNKVVTDHIWITLTKTISKSLVTNLECYVGKRICFNGRIKAYEKGYKGHDFLLSLERPRVKDFKVSHITNVKILD